MARPLKLTDSVIKKLSDARSIGSSMKVCAAYAGISVDTLHDWIVRAEQIEQEINNGRAIDTLSEKEHLFLRFLRSWRRAEADAAVTWQQVVNEAAEMDPKWAAWMLERFDPEGYSLRKQVDVTTKGEALRRPPEELSDEELLAIIKAEGSERITETEEG